MPTSRRMLELARQARVSDAPFRELSELLLLLRGLPERSVHAAAAERLLAAVPALAREQAWATEMQLGAEGFDNTTSARAYRAVQAALVQAGRELARACEVLFAQE